MWAVDGGVARRWRCPWRWRWTTSQSGTLCQPPSLLCWASSKPPVLGCCTPSGLTSRPTACRCAAYPTLPSPPPQSLARGLIPCCILAQLPQFHGTLAPPPSLSHLHCILSSHSTGQAPHALSALRFSSVCCGKEHAKL